ncbi:sortase [Aestuariimicrobium sp. p3-SID1156]|uniref:sortase domain-containing protein n=1 Tax=Aestuariimicrobium sp. p3-SID1156 TaxID=2916038 RepID=UPI00223AF3DF|nr:sortase [Aestuariimicrobium sp. p3-SID1156]MCT1458381.1 sortase [Aestuariimicrobium sp. p3-SID1156]
MAELTPRRRPWLLITLLVLLVLALVAGSAAVAWQVWGTNRPARSAASELVSEARTAWKAGKPHPKVLAVLSSEELGIEWPVLVGTSTEQLDRGLGWYPQTSRPGEKGNLAIAGRRITHGAPFAKLLDLREGNQITLETHQGRSRYRITTAPAQVDAGKSGGWVLDRVPGQDAEPTTSLLTLTTAADLLGTNRRAVVFAELMG